MDLPEQISPPILLDDFADIIDVRSPAEFAEDHIPGAINLPVLSDQQRHEVGLLNSHNSFEARRLGATLITQNIHQHLTTALAKKDNNFSPLIYCWRGNLRSNSMAVIFRAIGWRARVLEGGYKSWRRFLIDDLAKTTSQPLPRLIVLAGLTGCGKTHILHHIKEQGGQILDLEALANHRGSILGNEPSSPQPSQKQFETLLWKTFKSFDPTKPVFTESESNRIGKLQCPPSLWSRLGEGQVILINLSLENRAQFLTRDYPHFVKDPTTLKDTLNRLRTLRGNELIDHWHNLIDQNKWTDLVESLLHQHYDQVYRSPGSDESVYRLPSAEITLPNSTELDFQRTAHHLLISNP